MSKLFEITIVLFDAFDCGKVYTSFPMKLVRMGEEISEKKLEEVFLDYKYFSREEKKHAKYQFKEFFTAEEVWEVKVELAYNTSSTVVLATEVDLPMPSNKLAAICALLGMEECNCKIFPKSIDTDLPQLVGIYTNSINDIYDTKAWADGRSSRCLNTKEIGLCHYS